MYYQEFLPHPALQGHIRSYYFFSSSEDVSGADNTFRFPSDGGPELIVNLGMPFRAGPRADQLEVFRGCRLIGPLTRNLLTNTGGRAILVAVRFLPGHLAPFFRLPAAEIVDSSVSLDDITGNIGYPLEQRIVECSSVERIPGVLDQVLLDCLSVERVKNSGVEAALRAISLLGGQIKVETLAGQVGMSRRQLERHFLARVGMSPKRLCRIARFGSVFQYLKSSPDIDWADIAFRCGYSDQPHLIREFQFFTGLSPRAYLMNQSPFEKSIWGLNGSIPDEPVSN